jgi:putative restriction endonuclease
MFGGATQYVESLNAILEYIETNQPTTDDLVGWHRGTFENVSSRDSILRRVDYLEDVGFIQQHEGRWVLGPKGEEYASDFEMSTLIRIMCERNLGLRSLLYELSVGSMTIDEISDQQLDTHADLGWTRGETDMALQRANWLRSMGLVRKRDEDYELTDDGRAFIDAAVEDWAHTEGLPVKSDDDYSAATYETVTQTRVTDPEFRTTVLTRYDKSCPISGVDHPGLIDVAHVLSWSTYPDYRSDLSNVLPLSKTHHAAFDRELFTIDQEYRIQANPDFETQSELLKKTIINRSGERFDQFEGNLDPNYLVEYNSSLAWL